MEYVQAKCSFWLYNFFYMANGRHDNQIPKTFAEFELFRQHLFAIPFKSQSSNPISLGAERTQFEIDRLRRLLQVAQHVEGKTVRVRTTGWERQLNRTERNYKRFRELL